MASNTNNTVNLRPHILLSPYVEYTIPSNTEEPISEVRIADSPWYVARPECSDHFEVPLHREWKSQVTQGDLNAGHFDDITSKGDSPIKLCCKADLINETEHQLESVHPPENTCYASSGHHVIAILSEKEKNLMENASLTSELVWDDLGGSTTVPLQNRDVTFSRYTEDGTDYIRCTFAEVTDEHPFATTAGSEMPGLKTAKGKINYPFGKRGRRMSHFDETEFFKLGATAFTASSR
ncbi:hypothetical protein V866_008388 [Kwoniella sp. B9012]|uniref:Uncharacterized protein n=1 Tax=Kwoniella europaea PYCC6329 TaxID=1423913 RepID=A0AAX4KUT6_9TREE